MLVRESGIRLDDLAVLLGDRPFFYADEPGAADFAIYRQRYTRSSKGITSDFAEQVDRREALVAWRKRLEDAMGQSWFE